MTASSNLRGFGAFLDSEAHLLRWSQRIESRNQGIGVRNVEFLGNTSRCAALDCDPSCCLIVGSVLAASLGK